MESNDQIKKIKHSVSIIIPCYNEEQNLPKLLESIEIQKYDQVSVEVIVVDNGSTDRSVAIAKEYKAEVLVYPKVNISSLRNLGSKRATGEFYVFIDADCIPVDNWLREIVKYIEKKDIGIVGSIPLYPDNGTWVEKAWFGISTKGVKDVHFICSGNMVIRKEVFDLIGGFDDNLTTGEDYDICQRVLETGFRIVNDEKISIVHFGYTKTLFERFKKEIWYGQETFKILKIDPFYKPFWASLLYGISFSIVIFCGIISHFGILMKGAAFFFIIIPILSAAFKVIQSKRYDYFFYLVILYNVYLAGRFSALPVCVKKYISKRYHLS